MAKNKFAFGESWVDAAVEIYIVVDSEDRILLLLDIRHPRSIDQNQIFDDVGSGESNVPLGYTVDDCECDIVAWCPPRTL